MKDWEDEVLEQYDIDVKNKKRVRNGVLCGCEQGVYLLGSTTISEQRLGVLNHLTEELNQRGFGEVDEIFPNREGNLSCQLEDGSRYWVKKWFTGRECDVKKEQELLAATKNLAQLHKALDNPIEFEGNGSYQREDSQQVMFRRNRELKKVRSFIRQRVDKGEFESAFLKYFDSMYDWADGALAKLKESNYKNLERKLVHGDYNYHNLLVLKDGMATTNFEHFGYQVQVEDFYYFLRKAMEKNQWDVKLGVRMIECYHKIKPISIDEMEYISILFAYPEKFWKAANSYARSKKSWIPAKNMEKLELVIQQTKEKQIFLEKVFDFRL